MNVSILIYFFIFGFAMSSSLRGMNYTNNLVNYNEPSDTQYFCTSNYQCPINSDCSWYNKTTGICSCNIEYATVTDFCQYKRKSALIGLLLTIFLEFIAPVGKMYALSGITSVNNVAQSTIIGEMFTCGALGQFLILIPLSFLTCCIEGDVRKSIIILFTGILFIITFCWYIIDIIGFANNTILDQNGISLIPI